MAKSSIQINVSMSPGFAISMPKNFVTGEYGLDRDRYAYILKCLDGFGVNVQANSEVGCYPRHDHAISYTHFEVRGVNYCMPDSWNCYYDPDMLYFQMVPGELIRELLLEHGGPCRTQFSYKTNKILESLGFEYEEVIDK